MDYSARWYSPVNGRFTTQDTWTGDSFFPQTLNRYAYALNNPINITDPKGHIPCMHADNGELLCSFDPPDDWGTPSGPGNGGGGGGDWTAPYDTWDPPPMMVMIVRIRKALLASKLGRKRSIAFSKHQVHSKQLERAYLLRSI